MRGTFLLIVIHLLWPNLSIAQIDPHFSQYYAYQLWLNPAMTGVIDGDLRVNGNFKNQWSTIDNGYKTRAISADVRMGERMGLGLNIFNQVTGDGYSYTAAYGSYSYGVPVSNSQYSWLHFGLQVGFVNRNLDVNKLQFGSQYDPAKGYDPSLPSNELFLSSNNTNFDASGGIFYHDDDDAKKFNIFAGISIAHLFNPDINVTNTNNYIPTRYTIHGGARLKAGPVFDLIPHLLYVKQQTNEIRALGLSSEIKSSNDNRLIVGGMYRINDALILNAGYRFRRITLGTSYDFNTSDLRGATNTRGGIEVSLSYVVKGERYSRPLCPRF